MNTTDLNDRPTDARNTKTTAVRWLAILAALWLAVVPTVASAQDTDAEPGFLTVYGGAFDVLRSEFRGAELGIQYRPAYKFWYMNPVVGMNASSVGNVYMHVGISFDIFLGNRFVVRPNFGPGIFLRTDGKDLGHVIEFRTGLELAYRMDDRSRLGIEISHRSNAGLGGMDGKCPCNPGEESLVLSYHIPLGGRR